MGVRRWGSDGSDRSDGSWAGFGWAKGEGKMKVSLRVGFRRDDPVSPLDGVLRDCKEMGFDGIELMLDPRNSYGASGGRGGGRGPWASESVTPEIRAQLRDSAQRHGVEISTLS